MKKHLFENLLEKITTGVASDEELALYQNWYQQQLKEDIDLLELQAAKAGVSEEIYSRILEQLSNSSVEDSELQPGNFFKFPKWTTWIAAAAILIFAGLSYTYFFKNSSIQLIESEYQQASIDTTDGVFLSLSDGQKINLNTSTNEELAKYNDKNISINNKEIQLTESNNKTEKQDIKYNSLYTSSGKTYKITLADGSKVWLNTKSMLRFPTNFSEPTRRVQLIGEGYFEVTSIKNQPFIVESKGQELQVVGTKFNISTYEDDSSIRSTVTEGKVSVKNLFTNQSLMIYPGEQVQLSENIFQKTQINIRDVLGWKNNYFVFQHEKLSEICKTLSRWYDVDFDMSKNPKIKNQVFSGTVEKFENIEDVLAVLSATDAIQFKKEGRRVLLMN